MDNPTLYDMEKPEKSEKPEKQDNHALIERIIGYPITAFTLVVAFAWNSAFQNWFSNHPRFKHHGPWIYAISLTIICVLFITALYFIQNQAESASDSMQKNIKTNGKKQGKTDKQTKQTKQTNNPPQIPKESFMLLY